MACKLTKKGIKPCNGLKAVLQFTGGRGTRQQGAEIQTLIDLKTMKFSRQIVVLKSGEHGKSGVIMNHCPFCAAQIYEATAA